MWSNVYVGLYVTCLLFFSDCNETWIFTTDFRKKYLSDKFNESLSSGNSGVPCGRTDRHTEITTKPTVAFLHFANAPYKLVEYRQYNVWANRTSSNWFMDNIQDDFYSHTVNITNVFYSYNGSIFEQGVYLLHWKLKAA